MPRADGQTTAYVRRQSLQQRLPEQPSFETRFAVNALQAQAAVAAIAPRPFGDLDSTSVTQLTSVVETTLSPESWGVSARIEGIAFLLGVLSDFDGDTWQERWLASGFDAGLEAVSSLRESKWDRGTASWALKALISLRVLRPSLVALKANRLMNLPELFREVQSDPKLDQFFEFVEAQPIAVAHKRNALLAVTYLMVNQDVSIGDVTPEALLHFVHEFRAANIQRSGRETASEFNGRAAWDMLYRIGYFPRSAPSTLRGALNRGQRTVEELIDQYPIRNRSVRQLLVEYITRRRADLDYSSLKNLASFLANLFWAEIEKINPEQADLKIDQDTYLQWRETVRYWGKDRKPRKNQDSILLAVRALYIDIQTWALEEPEIWAPWVATCPVPAVEYRGYAAARRRHKAEIDDRIRQRQPLLPTLVGHLEGSYEHLAAMLEQATACAVDEQFAVGGHSYTRVLSVNDRGDPLAPIRVRDADGVMVNVTSSEDTAFWDWAMVEVLRHTGIRIEELTELTHLSIRQYQRPNGEVIALLVITPSKTDRERVIPMSGEVFHVFALIMKRLTSGGRTIPLLERWDMHEKTWSPPLPYLFQLHKGAHPVVINSATITGRLRRHCEKLAESNPAFQGLRFTPHDFRRLFATELVNSGLPIHIGAALLGHLNLETTRGYVAVFQEDLVRHYQLFLESRRALRPPEEYTPVTAEEWADFEEHFDKRKVELGSCARAYGTACAHEHACIRCALLHVNPKMIGRLSEIEEDLVVRRERAAHERWLGEIEQIDLTLSFLRAKKQEAEVLRRRGVPFLGIPKVRTEQT